MIQPAWRGGIVCIPRWNHPRSRWNCRKRRRRRRSCPSADWASRDAPPGWCASRVKGSFFRLGAQWDWDAWFRMAGRLRRVHRERFPTRSGSSLHRTTSGASSHAHVSRGVSGIAAPQRREIWWTLRLIQRPCRGLVCLISDHRWLAPPANFRADPSGSARSRFYTLFPAFIPRHESLWTCRSSKVRLQRGGRIPPRPLSSSLFQTFLWTPMSRRPARRCRAWIPPDPRKWPSFLRPGSTLPPKAWRAPTHSTSGPAAGKCLFPRLARQSAVSGGRH